MTRFRKERPASCLLLWHVPTFLALRQVSKSFGSNLALDRVSFAVMRGETLCVMGRSGVGKSVRKY
jgi:ABC-type sugar transport system ATPase subunit